jgi:BASS family bile acid:Na+ symporter
VDSAAITLGLPIALAIIMFGLGLSLTVDDFRRTAQQPLAVGVALVAQVLLLPAVCLGLVLVLGLDPVLGLGMMLLAASPGGTSANLFSHLFRGDVALNVSLTAINSVLAVLTLPLVVNLSVAVLDPPTVGGAVGLQFDKTLQVFALVLVPVVLGMVVRRLAPAFAQRADRPVRIVSAVVLGVVIIAAIVGNLDVLGEYLAQAGLAAVLFCAISLAVGYFLPRLLRVGHRQAIATSFEIGVHNGTLAITIAVSVLGDERLAIPPAVYGVFAFPMALVAGWLFVRTRAARSEPVLDTP